MTERPDGTASSGVVLSRIYTKTGDDGTTALGDMSRAPKSDPRVAAYGAVDETNSAIGVALALGDLDDDIATLLKRIQNDLFDVGADLCTPVVAKPEYPPLRVTEEDVERLEKACDDYNERVEKLRSFVLPSGTPAAAQGDAGRPPAARRANGHQAGRKAYVGGHREVRRRRQRNGGALPQPAV